MAIIHLDITIKGRIQNIGFAFQILKIADEAGICGYAYYSDKDSLKIEAEGEEPILKMFVKKCKTGIPEAHINKLEIKQSAVQNFTGFKIL